MSKFYHVINRPPVQAAIVLGAAIILMAAGWALMATGLMAPDPLFAWSMGAAFMLFFALLNSLMSIRAASFAKYWGASMYSYTGLALSTSLAAWIFSGIPIREAGSYRWIYIVITVGFLVFLTMVNFMKIIVRFAEKEEWHQPRKRR